MGELAARAGAAITYAGRWRLRLVGGRNAEDLLAFVTENMSTGSTVRSNGWQCYDRLNDLGYTHDPLVMGGDPRQADQHLPMIHLVFSNLKTWTLGTHHGAIEHQHSQAYSTSTSSGSTAGSTR